jgi:transcriptional regulator
VDAWLIHAKMAAQDARLSPYMMVHDAGRFLQLFSAAHEAMMYQPAFHREERLSVQHDLIRAHPLGLLIINGAAGLEANPVPFILDAERGEKGTLLCHIARANPAWRNLDPQAESLAVFMGPQVYVTPSWYETKRETGKVVPTWNYATVHAYGRVRVIEDHDWLLAQIRALTQSQEGDRAHPWAVEDAPASFVDQMIAAIIGLEIPIERIEGKWKVSQNRTEADRAGVIAGLREEGGAQHAAMAELVATADAERKKR